MAQAPMRLVVGGNLAIKGSLAKAGQYLLASRVFTSDLVRNFAELSLDYNPIHLDADSAREANGYEKPIVHGMLYSSMFSAMFATKLPGSIYRSQTLSFHAPVYIDDEVEARIDVVTIRQRRNLTILTCNTKICVIGGARTGLLAVDGKAKVVTTT